MQAFIKTVYLKNLNNSELSVGLPGCLLPPLRIPLPAGRAGLCSEPIPNLELSIFKGKRESGACRGGGKSAASPQLKFIQRRPNKARTLLPSLLVTYFEDLQVHFGTNKASTASGTNATRPSRALQPGSSAAVEVQGPVKDLFYFIFFPGIAQTEKSFSSDAV